MIRSPECANQGDSDVYGLGVRVGLYLQWFAGFILRNIGSWNTMTRVRTANNTLCIALALAEAIKIVGHNILAINYLLSYYLTVILFYSESYRMRLEVGGTIPTFEEQIIRLPDSNNIGEEMMDKIKSYTLVPDLSLLFQNVFFTACTLFGASFCLHEISRIQESPCSEYAAIILLFHLREDSWRIAVAVLAILFGLFWAFVFVFNLGSFLSVKGKDLSRESGPIMIATYRTLRFFGDISAMTWLVPQPQEIGVSFKCPLSRNVFHYILLNLLGSFVAIIPVERIVSRNNLTTSEISSSTGQMIAFVTGITSVLCTLWELARWLGKKKTSFSKFWNGRDQSDGSSHGERDPKKRHKPPSKSQLDGRTGQTSTRR